MANAKVMSDFLLDLEKLMDAPPGSLSSDSEFRSLPAWDSLKLLDLLAMLDKSYGVTVDADRLEACKTVLDLFNLVNA